MGAWGGSAISCPWAHLTKVATVASKLSPTRAEAAALISTANPHQGVARAAATSVPYSGCVGSSGAIGRGLLPPTTVKHPVQSPRPLYAPACWCAAAPCCTPSGPPHVGGSCVSMRRFHTRDVWAPCVPHGSTLHCPHEPNTRYKLISLCSLRHRFIHFHHLRSLVTLRYGRSNAADYDGSMYRTCGLQASHWAPPGSAYRTRLLGTMVALLSVMSRVRASSTALHVLWCRGHA